MFDKTIKNKNMKLLFSFFLFGILSFTSFSQVYFSCNFREECDWNNSTEKFEGCEKWENISMIKLNKDGTVFTHTTDDLTSRYYVDSKEYDETYDVYTYNVVSDNGNKYYWIIDLTNSEIRLMPLGTEEIYLVRFYVKKSWAEEG
jgi:hypothetical protein